MMTSIILLGLGCACAGYVFAEERPWWFGWWYFILLWIETRGEFGRTIAKPLGQCAKCTSGFLCMILSVWMCPANILSHIIAPSVAILAVRALHKYEAWSKL